MLNCVLRGLSALAVMLCVVPVSLAQVGAVEPEPSPVSAPGQLLVGQLDTHQAQLTPPSGAGEAAGEELSFDDIPESAAPSAAASLSHWYDFFHLSGRFDLNYELDNPLLPESHLSQGRLRNYHRFLFLRASPLKNLSLEAEIIDLSFYELKYSLPHDVEVRAGKIWVPFGATPFHHFYGGRQGSPFQGLLVPNVWAEYGLSISYPLVSQGPARLSGTSYLIRGFEGVSGEVLPLNLGGADARFSLGQRLVLGIGSRASFTASALYNRWGELEVNQVLLWGLDARLDYGLIPLPVLKDFSLRAALARAEVQDVLISPTLLPDGWYWRYGDYLELSYAGLRPWVTLRGRYGTVIDFNLVESQNDVHNWEAAVIAPLGDHLSLLVQYQWNMEEKDEVDNDLLRLQLTLDF